MKFKRVEHVAIAVKNMDKMRDIFENKLGIQMEYEEDKQAMERRGLVLRTR